MFKIKQRLKRKKEHAYRVRLRAMIEHGMLPMSPGLHELYVRHDPDCKLWRGGYCNCDPTFEFQHEAGYTPETTVN
jgi:hypothetical protein